MPPKHNKKKGFYGGKKSLTDFDSIQGILFTCNGARQKEAAQEALGLVELFGDKLVETIDTLQNDILEMMTKEREKIIAASKKKQERINARISREQQGVLKPIPSVPVEAKAVTENMENKSIEEQVVPSGSDDTQRVVEQVDKQQAQQEDKQVPPIETNSETANTSSNSTTTNETKQVEPLTGEVQQHLTTWQLKEKNKPPQTGLDISTILSCEYLETELKIVKDGSKNYELLETGIPGQVFVRIRNRAISPVALCQKISKHFKKAYDNKEEISSRFLFKMFPICDMFQANENNLNNRFPKMIENKVDITKSVKYVVNIKSHHNNTLDKKVIYETISQRMPSGTAVMSHAGVEFHVFLMKGKCLLGISTDCDIVNYNINAMRHTTTQDDILKENQRNASKRKATEMLLEAPLEVADMIEVENSKINETEKEDETMEDNTTESVEHVQAVVENTEDGEMYEYLEEITPVPLIETTISIQVYSKRRKVQNHPSMEFDDIKVI